MHYFRYMYGRQYCNVSNIQVQIMDFVDVGEKAWRGGAMGADRVSMQWGWIYRSFIVLCPGKESKGGSFRPCQKDN